MLRPIGLGQGSLQSGGDRSRLRDRFCYESKILKKNKEVNWTLVQYKYDFSPICS